MMVVTLGATEILMEKLKDCVLLAGFKINNQKVKALAI